jgi:gluconate 2-dehydrogenase alpha chain
MATRLKEVDAVMVGMGWTGAIMARELTKAGLKVVGLERGQDRTPGEDFTLPGVRDEMKYSQRLELMMDNSTDTITFRNAAAEMALPIRRIGAFLPGEGVGGSGIHWGALHWRNLPSDFRIRSHIQQRYGANAIPDDMTITDWPVSYDELETHYDRFDKLCGVSGQAGNINGKIVPGGNPFEGPLNIRTPRSSRRCLRRCSARPPKALAFTRSRRRSRSRARLIPMSRAWPSVPANTAATAIAWPARRMPRHPPTRR